MDRAYILRSTDLNHIAACATPAIVSRFLQAGYKYTKADLEEVLSETYKNVAVSYDEYDETISRKAWFAKIAWNCAGHYLPKAIIRRCLFTPLVNKTTDGVVYETEYSDRESSAVYSADFNAISYENMKLIRKACDSLDEKDGEIVWLSAQGYTNSEIADRLGFTVGAIKTRKCRALKVLRNNKHIRALCKEFLPTRSVAA